MDDGSYNAVEAKRFGVKPESLSPTSINTDSDGSFKNKDDFIKAMYPLAVKAAEALGGIDPNALLTQWGFESAWGQKVSGKHNYFGIKADKSWTGDKKDVMTHEFVAGQKIKIPQPFRSYSSPEEAVDDYVKFLKNTKRYTKAGVFNAKTSSEFFTALQSAGYATDPNYASKLTAATASTASKTASLMPVAPSTGPNLAQGSTTMAAMTRDMSVAQAPNVVVNAPQTNVASGKGQSAPVASATNVDALELFFRATM
jgi:flagellar protein FlgJ